MLRYMPKFLVDKYRKEPKMQVKLRNTFDRFVKLSESVGIDHYFGKYVEVYEKDKMCGRHIYRLRPVRWLVVGILFNASVITSVNLPVNRGVDLSSLGH